MDTMESLLREMDEAGAEAKRGDILDGEIVRIDRDGILVDIHMKSEGIVPPNSAQRYHDENTTIEADVIDYNKGGLIVDVDGVRGFVPISQVASRRQSSSPE